MIVRSDTLKNVPLKTAQQVYAAIDSIFGLKEMAEKVCRRCGQKFRYRVHRNEIQRAASPRYCRACVKGN